MAGVTLSTLSGNTLSAWPPATSLTPPDWVGRFPSPVMGLNDDKLVEVITRYFLPVLSMHHLELRREAVGGECKLLCTRCGEVRRFVLPTEPMSPQRVAVEAYLKGLVDEHFRPWESISCMKDGELRAKVAEWLTHTARFHGVVDVKDIPTLIESEGFAWTPEFVQSVADSIDFLDGEIVRLPDNHPYRKA